MDHAHHTHFAHAIPSTQEEFLEDRTRFWIGFTRVAALSAVVVIGIVALMGLSLV
jgi:hypothetical protein